MTKYQSSSLLLLCPDLCSNIIIKEHGKKGLRFHCYAAVDAEDREYHSIELWSNLTTLKQWTGFPMTKTDAHEYELTVNTSYLPPGDYEFTLRFTFHYDEEWLWYGKLGQNGHVRVTPHSIIPAAPSFATVPQLQFVAKQHAKKDDILLYHFKTQQTPLALGTIKHPIHNYVALIRKGCSWFTPIAGETNFDKRSSQERWQALLYQDKDAGNIHLWIVLGQKVDCWLSPGSNNTLNFNKLPYENKDEAHLIICSTTKTHNFARLLQTALMYYDTSIKEKETGLSVKNNDNGMLSEPDSAMLDSLGYCTWNAFGKSVSEKDLFQAMESLQSRHIPISYIIIDDGWQSILNSRMASMDTSKEKFPDGLKRTISKLKSKFPFLKSVGVWHALWGYWDGVDKTFAEKQGYTIDQAIDKNGKEIGIVKNPEKFYKEFYQFLQHAEVDFVKVDNQGAFQDLVINGNNNTQSLLNLWDKYRQAMIQSSDEFLEGNVRHCMSFTPHILFDGMLSTKKKSIFRNSDDFFPGEKDSHAWHIYANAINSLWISYYPVISDWDMFQSDHPFAEYHASSRAISGGPIYITDFPNEHNLKLIQRLVGQTRHNGFTLLRSTQTPQPTFETVFGNIMERQALICLYNIHREDSHHQSNAMTEEKKSSSKPDEYSVIGFWNTRPCDQLGIVSSRTFCSRKLVLKPTVAYVVSGPDCGKLVPLNPLNFNDYGEEISSGRNSPITILSSSPVSSTGSIASLAEVGLIGDTSVRVSGLSSTLVSISHVRSVGVLSIACLGLVDKFNGTRSISKTTLTKQEQRDYYAIYEAYLTHKSSCCGFWISSSSRKRLEESLIPQRIVLDGYELESGVDWTYNIGTGFLKVNMMTVEVNVSTEDYFHIQIYI